MMRTRPICSLSVLASFVLLLTMSLGSTAALASTGPSAGLIAGSMSQAIGFGTFGSTTLNGVSQVLTGDMRIGVFDQRGVGTGWHLNVSIVPFQSYNSDGSPTTVDHVLNTSNTVMSLVSNSGQPACVGAADTDHPDPLIGYSTGTADTNCVNGSVYTPSANEAIPFSSATDVMWAVANSTDTHLGMGNYAVTDSLSITFPANAYAATYKTTVTVLAIDGPGSGSDFTHP